MKYFRLSILQMLVAMAVVAGFVAANRMVFTSTQPSWEALKQEFELPEDIVVLRVGWPLAFYEALGRRAVGNEMNGVIFYSGRREYRGWSLLGNIAVCAVVLVVVIVGVGSIQRRTAFSTKTS